MANRYDNREQNRSEDRGFGGNRYGRNRENNDRERSFRDREFDEGISGSNRSYGNNPGGSDPDLRNMQSQGRDAGRNYRSSDDRYLEDRTRDSYGSAYGPNYGTGYGGNYGEGWGRVGGQGRGDLGGGYYGYGRAGYYGSDYPESERGYSRDRGARGGDERGWFDRASDEVSSWFGDEDAARRRETDSRQSGEHRGRGPRNYTRSDDRIRDDVNDQLTDSWTLDASDIEVEVTSGDVTLTGTVNTRYEKRLAEDLAEDVSGVKNVENRIRVQEISKSPTSFTDTNTGETGSDQATQKSRTATGNK